MSRWQINRAGVINFWYYDDDEFVFENGRLLLRGANGSGKSVTMQSLVPLLFDGNKSPERLDPFGSRARKMDTYLLSDGLELDERTGYLFLEFHKPNSDRYLTIGMGMLARKNMTTKTWYFVVNDNRRVGHAYDLSLYRDIGKKIPLTQKELENRLGLGGQLYTRQKDYKIAVNNHLFGYSDINDFDELITLLIQIRSPKLSKEFKPTTMYEIMQNSLFTLTEEDLRPMSEAIESMDTIKEKLDNLKRSKKSFDKIDQVFKQYNQYLLARKADLYLKSSHSINQLTKDIHKTSAKLDKNIVDLDTVNIAIEDLQEQEVLLKQQESQLKEHDLSKLTDDKLSFEKIVEENQQRINEKSHKINELESKEVEFHHQLKVHEEQLYTLNNELMEVIEALRESSEEASYDECEFMIADFEEKGEVNFSHYQLDLKKYTQKVKEGLEAIKAYDLFLKNYNELLARKEKVQKIMNDSERSVLAYERQLDEIKAEYAEEVSSWHKSLKTLTFDALVISQSVECIFQYGDMFSFEEVKEPIYQAYQSYASKLNAECSQLLGEKQLILDDMEKEKKRLKKIQDMKEPEPERSQEVIENRAGLKTAGIPFMPLYQALDFNQDVDQKMKNMIEESLLAMGLLDAIVIDPKYKQKVLSGEFGCDTYIFSQPNLLSHNLSHHLKVEKGTVVRSELIADVLQSIFLDQGTQLFINHEGIFANGILHGKVNGSKESRFISYLSRKRYKNEQIIEVKASIDLLKSLIDKKDEEILCYKHMQSLALKEYHMFPSHENLKIAYDDLMKEKHVFVEKKRQYDEALLSLEESDQSLKIAKRLKHEKTNLLLIDGTVVAFEAALESLDLYRDELNLFMQVKMKIDTAQIGKARDVDLIEQVKMQLDDLRHDSFDLERQTRQYLSRIDNIMEQLKASDYSAFVEKRQAIDQQLRGIPSKRTKLYEEKSTCQTNVNLYNNKLNEMNQRIVEATKQCQLYSWAFEEEWGLELLPTVDLESLEEKGKYALQAFGTMLDEHTTVTDYRDRLNKRFHEEQGVLVEFNMKMTALFKEIPFDEVSNEDRLRIERINITTRKQGKIVTFTESMKLVQQEMDINQHLLNEKDRELFEEILINSVSRKISSKIYHSERWVKEIDKLMSERKTSSGLRFSLRWLPKHASSEEEISTRELINTLKTDPSLLTDGQKSKMILHFRSKINSSKNRIGTDDHRSFLAIMKDVLDYRKWFEFKLYFVKPGDQKKELTNNAFFTFSGGEKAMAMYVPLFSAVYAKYQSGAIDCPRVVSLDEAFAGVDEMNIDDMFKLMVDLKLGFIANSQALFGDYASVPSLSIYELIRPENVTFVTTIRYLWNGNRREVIN